MPGLNTPPLIDFRSWAVFGPHTKSDLSRECAAKPTLNIRRF